MYRTRLLEIQQKGDSVQAQQLAPGVSVMDLAVFSSVSCLKAPPFQEECGDVGAQHLEASGVGVFAPPRSASTASTTVSGASVLVPRPPPPPPSLLPRVSQDIAEVVGLIHPVLTELTVLKQENKASRL